MNEPTKEAAILLCFGCLFFLAGLGFSPSASGRAAIWVEPKVTLWLLSLVPLLLGSIHVLRRRHQPASSAPQIAPAIWAAGGMSLAIGVSGIVHPTALSWFGYPSLPEGTAYHLVLLPAMMVSAWLTTRISRLAHVCAVSVVAISVVATGFAIPQKFDWTIDYTRTSGQLRATSQRQTVAGIWPGQSPNSLYWHRGHFGIVAAIGLVVASGLNLRSGGGPEAYFRIMIRSAVMLTALGLVLSDTRSPQLAGALGLATLWTAEALFRKSLEPTRRPLLREFVTTQLSPVVLGMVLGVIISAAAGNPRDQSLAGQIVSDTPSLRMLLGLSGRERAWSLAWDAWRRAPYSGHGFLAFHSVIGREQAARAAREGILTPLEAERYEVLEHQVVVRRDDGTVWRQNIWGTKPHNFILEYLVSVGIVGTGLLLALLASITHAALASRSAVALAVVVSWVFFLMFWYDSIQYGPVVWIFLATNMGVRGSGPPWNQATAATPCP